MTRSKPGSCMPRSSKKTSLSSSGRSEISASILAQTATTMEFSLAACSWTWSRSGLFSKPPSSTLATYIVGFIVRRKRGLMTSFSSGVSSTLLAGWFSLRAGWSFSKTLTSFKASLSPPERACLEYLANCFSTVAKSARANSVLMTSMSSSGLTWLATWVMFSSSKHLTMCAIASHSRMFAKNLFPKPSPWLAPATKPAISTNSTVAGMIFWGWTISASLASLGSGTSTIPTFGSIVQNG